MRRREACALDSSPRIACRGGWGRVRFHLLDSSAAVGWGCAPPGAWGAVSAILILTQLSDSLPFSASYSWSPCSPLFLCPPLSRVSLALCCIPLCGCPPPSCVPVPPSPCHSPTLFFSSLPWVSVPCMVLPSVSLFVSPRSPPAPSPWPCVPGLSPASGA